MWAERWVKVCPRLKFIQTNTDGQTIYIPREDIDKIRAVNEQLTAETGLTIEEVVYKKMIVRDVRNLRRNLVNCWKAEAQVVRLIVCQSAAKSLIY